jgi:hypothetical protein
MSRATLITTTHIPAATRDHYRQIRDVERDTGDLRHDLHPEPGPSPLFSSDRRAEYEPTADNG